MPELTSAQLSEEFPGNEWLVADIYEKYKADRSSVDPKWAEIFARLEGTAATQQKRHGGDSDKGTSRSAQPQQKNASTKSSATSTTKKESNSQSSASSSSSSSSPSSSKSSGPKVRRAEGSSEKAIPSEPPKSKQKKDEESHQGEDTWTQLKGATKAIASNMNASLSMPTATTVRDVPVKALIDNRVVINNSLKRARGGKVSFTHLIGYAVIKALVKNPGMNTLYREEGNKKYAVQPAHINFGLAIDLPQNDGSRVLVQPSIKKVESMNFREFWEAYEELVSKARNNKLTLDDHSGTTVSLTNPGGIGTVHSVPRLSEGQAAIIGVGALNYPAAFQGTSQEVLSRWAVSKTLTLTSTYDHRVIQGAASGAFLNDVHQYLLGADGFYDEIFKTLRIPYEPVRWKPDVQVNPGDEIGKVARIQQLIAAYRTRGHLMADVDPLEYRMRTHPDLDIIQHGLTLWDLDRSWATGNFGGKSSMLLRDILGVLRDAYCRNTGVEYMHIDSPEEREWFQDKLEHPYSKPSREEQLHILSRLNAAEAFETFLQTKFVGQKRFSLEGSESLIALLDAAIGDAADDGLDEVAIAMAHRGRLNVLTNIAGKTYTQVFREFTGNIDPETVQGSGDVKYHLGTGGTFTSYNGNTTKVSLAANPSHLEAADPVLEGIVRAKQDRLDRGSDSPTSYSVMPILVHGDAAMAGQGVVYETFALSQLRGYRTGGTIHVVVNNQVGFTTPPSQGRSSTYATDVAKSVNAPVFHVNGDDPESVVHVAKLAYDYRERFHKDIVIDLVSYRRRGHNEGDDPSMTQPRMYNLIENKRSVRKLYVETLVGRGDITQEEADSAMQDYKDRLERAFAEIGEAETSPIPILGSAHGSHETSEEYVPEKTAISEEVLRRIGEAHTEYPEGFTVHKKLKSMLEKRAKMSVDGDIDWGFAELLAFGSLLMEGTPVRVTGQDTRRGTFVQRHAVFYERETNDEWTPLANLSEDQAKFWIYNSPLSEFACVGFEYGYSVERPDALVAWEAQFGDFANGAQTVVDEFISSSEQKWSQHSSLVMLLPHGYEGQGPDHSSARIERYLQLCAQHNMRVVQPSFGANHFHLLREQAYSTPRRPLIVFTPKQLLRRREASSEIADFTQHGFRPVMGDDKIGSNAQRVLLVSGRLYYDLLDRRTKNEDYSTAIVRVEQLYPLPTQEIQEELKKYPEANLTWVQDEPENQGPWPFMAVNLAPELDREINVISRPASASPAAGSKPRHDQELEELLDEVFGK
ncbi:multifunctional oxoglutarate decarboxylase/oxoglutarate dehydrogenase thiamine pyrophosphate-binding subunit/dihydrolipoyllysine-residue succinyltransferase subunit [Auritidibacter ignavus]|uniref:multifunctional oxoglutarate decarboxylase/oxoglutarate dehydrogenase thiamine pyrophosphate-binding subunit/dihydrolipoyllysine-residue succinyltransferase subunit n=1 Tax=Auritidibacter ignavus TaxID=678932 RepID=UPI0024BA69FD|nr:multifunctional oxoglutarate decarboxylase/oxoglutarate dehydrogenase thiamine pyrophosphate-binding subunit/dihydrolipoyllysine-residue succinyltransferase subunit [Auritidibacter ignavus]WHS35198.1 multifunctional oxoglutarate decarboxylase/oxoglutarate dehydrogenase thiamine pyrophosphate-binding subunit/dihydrolipoyllysine-residue succinyltransferase subunit [Auritidibacter ignavus]